MYNASMDKSLPFQSLHGHTLDSDGVLTHKDVLDECLKNKVGVFAFTDHDVVPLEETVVSLKIVDHPVKFISGIEVSCDTMPEVEGKIPTLHVTGLFVDVINKALLDFQEAQIKDRFARMQKFVQNLKDLGFLITEEEVLNHVKGRAIIQPYIVSALKSHPENISLLEKFFEDLKTKAKTDKLRQKQLDEVLTREENQKWYILVMSKDSLHSAYVQYQNSAPISVDDAVRLIRGAGGIALLAHWSYSREKITLSILEKYLKENRLDGLETAYSFGENATHDLFWEDCQKLSALCKKYNLVEGGGVDFHRPENFIGMNDPRFSDFAHKTEGMLERILKKHPKLDFRWTSLS